MASDVRVWPHRRSLTPRARGYANGIAAIFIISPDALLLRLCSAEDPIFTTLCRTAWLAPLCLVTAAVQVGGLCKLCVHSWKHREPLLIVSATACGTSLGFAFSLQLTGAAEALLLISLNPLWAALIGWRCLGDELPRRTRWALAAAMVSIALVFLPHFLSEMSLPASSVASHPASRPVGGDQNHSLPLEASSAIRDHPYRLAGNLIALFTGMSLGAFGNSVRYAKTRFDDVPVQVAQVFSNSFAVLISLLLMAALGRPFRAVDPPRLIGLTLAMGLIINTAYLGMNRAPQYISAAEFGIICLLESILGPIWVFLVIGEAPTLWTLVGGGLILATLTIHELAAQYAAKTAASVAVAGDATCTRSNL